MKEAWWGTIFTLTVLDVLLFGFRSSATWVVSVVLVIMLIMSAAATLIWEGKRNG